MPLYVCSGLGEGSAARQPGIERRRRWRRRRIKGLNFMVIFSVSQSDALANTFVLAAKVCENVSVLHLSSSGGGVIRSIKRLCGTQWNWYANNQQKQWWLSMLRAAFITLWLSMLRFVGFKFAYLIHVLTNCTFHWWSSLSKAIMSNKYCNWSNQQIDLLDFL